MSKRLKFGLLTITFSVLAWLLWQCLPQPRIGPRNFGRIQPGMTSVQVEELIGLPPGDYYIDSRGVGGSTSLDWFLRTCQERGIPTAKIPRSWYRVRKVGQQTGRVCFWTGDDYSIIVAFDETDKAVSWQLSYVVPAVRGPGIVERLRDWLARLW